MKTWIIEHRFTGIVKSLVYANTKTEARKLHRRSKIKMSVFDVVDKEKQTITITEAPKIVDA